MAGVLVVDDEPDIREELADILRDRGYATSTAANGADALMQLRSLDAPCLILLDLMMPVMDGAQFRQEQAKDPQLAAIPIIVISGAADVRNKAADLKAQGYLVKPFALRDLFQAVERFCPPRPSTTC